MIKQVQDRACVFDIEYAPCIETGRRVYSLSPDTHPKEVLETMYAKAPLDQKNPTNPTPMLKTFMHRIVSISGIVRDVRPEAKVKLQFRTLPDPITMTESEMIYRFLSGVGGNKMQLVGFASRLFDVPVLVQRALIHSLSVPPFFRLPEKPWLGTDYLSKFTDSHIDLMEACSCNGDPKSKPKLDEIAKACGFPGKIGMEGSQVAQAFFDGRLKEIVEYNECDAATTYLLWLRCAATAGLLDYEIEAGEFRQLLYSKRDDGAKHIGEFLEAWQ